MSESNSGVKVTTEKPDDEPSNQTEPEQPASKPEVEKQKEPEEPVLSSNKPVSFEQPREMKSTVSPPEKPVMKSTVTPPEAPLLKVEIDEKVSFSKYFLVFNVSVTAMSQKQRLCFSQYSCDPIIAH